MTRRQFGLAVAAAAAAPRSLRIGVGTYSYHSLPMQAMVAELAVLGIREVEMSRGEFMLLSRPKADLFRAARTLFDKANIRCVSYYAATIHDDGELDAAVGFAGLLGASNITGDAARPLLKRIDERCTRAGLTFGLHNHYFKEGFPYESPEDVLSALEGLSDTMGATLDTGQFASCGYDAVDATRKLRAHLKLVHLKDVAASGGERNVLLGRGVAKIPDVMRELREAGFRGLVAVEYEKDGPVEADMREQVAFARKLAATRTRAPIARAK